MVNAVNLALRNSQDFHARIGGEEFAIILQDISKEELQRVIDRILKNVSSIEIPDNSNIHITCSIGYTKKFSQSNTTMRKMMSLADQALYQAKLNGRNQAAYINDEDV